MIWIWSFIPLVCLGSGGGCVSGFLGGLADGLMKDRIGKEAFNNVMDRCIARYVWRY